MSSASWTVWPCQDALHNSNLSLLKPCVFMSFIKIVSLHYMVFNVSKITGI